MVMLKVMSMNCKSCAHNIEDHLRNFDSKISLDVDIQNKVITVNSDYNSEQIKNLVEESGYPAELI